MSNRARCNHCQGTFTVGGDRDCCLAGAVAEQRRLRASLTKARTEARRHGFEQQMADLFGDASPFGGGR